MNDQLSKNVLLKHAYIVHIGYQLNEFSQNKYIHVNRIRIKKQNIISTPEPLANFVINSHQE